MEMHGRGVLCVPHTLSLPLPVCVSSCAVPKAPAGTDTSTDTRTGTGIAASSKSGGVRTAAGGSPLRQSVSASSASEGNQVSTATSTQPSSAQ